VGQLQGLLPRAEDAGEIIKQIVNQVVVVADARKAAYEGRRQLLTQLEQLTALQELAAPHGVCHLRGRQFGQRAQKGIGKAGVLLFDSAADQYLANSDFIGDLAHVVTVELAQFSFDFLVGELVGHVTGSLFQPRWLGKRCKDAVRTGGYTIGA
jgi:hypothetical protein